MKNLKKALKAIESFSSTGYDIPESTMAMLVSAKGALEFALESGDIVRKNPLIGRTLELSERGQLAVGDLLTSPVTVQKVVDRRIVVVDSNGLTAVVRRGDLS